MNKSIFKLIALIALQIGAYLALTRLLNFPFAEAFITSFIFALFIGALILEGSISRNSTAYIMSILNLVFILLLFIFSSSSYKPTRNFISNKNYEKISEQGKGLLIQYGRTEKIDFLRVFAKIAYYDYASAADILKKTPHQNIYNERLHTYVLKRWDEYRNELDKAVSLIPDFKKLYQLLQKNDLTGFMQNMRDFRENESGKFFYQVARKKMMMKDNSKVLKTAIFDEVNGFLSSYQFEKDTLFHTLALFPGIRKNYRSQVIKLDRQSISAYDFTGLTKRAKEYPNMMTIAHHPKSGDVFIFARALIESTNLYPLFALDLQIIDKEGKIFSVDFAKITPNSLVFFKGKSKEEFHNIPISGLYNKIENTLKLMKNPMTPFWFTSYKKDFPEVYEYLIKPFWNKFLKFIVILGLAFALVMFTVRYFKTVFPRKISPYFHLLPFFLLMVISIVYSHFVIKAFNLVLHLFNR